MGGKAAFVYSDDFSLYDFAPGHPLSPKRNNENSLRLQENVKICRICL